MGESNYFGFGKVPLMIQATYYQSSDGRIVSRATLLNEQEVEQNKPEGCTYFIGDYDQDLVWFPNGQIQTIPPKPDSFYDFDYSTGQWVADDASAMRALRDERNRRLAASDWTQVPDAPVDQAAWAAYRQQLRDLPDNTEDPRNPVWPTPPA
jgi:hypothetical protein